MSRLFRLLVGVVAIWLSGFSARAQVSFLEEARSGIALLEAGDDSGAEQALGRALDLAEKDDVTGENRARTLYNLGLSRLRQGAYEPAVASFEAASNESTSPELQAGTFHNAGTALAHYAEGIAAGDIEEELADDENPLQRASGVYEQSLNHFRKSLLLNPTDTDTKGSYEVARKAKQVVDEELRKQQEEQEEQDQDKEPSDDENEEDPESSEDDSDSQDPSDEKQDPSDDGEDGENKPAEGPEEGGEDPPEDQEDGKDPSDPSDDNQEQNEPKPGENESDTEASPPERDAQQMTPEEAELLLDKVKQDEEAQRVRARPVLGKPQNVDKDW